MKTLRLSISSLLLLSVAACGASPDSNGGFADEDPTPTVEATPEATPTVPPVVPNGRPDAPQFTLSTQAVKALDTVTIDLALNDPENDAMTTACTAVLTSESPEFDISGALTKLSEMQWSLTAPITATDYGYAVVRCAATDADGAASDLAESSPITIDNHVDIDSTDPGHHRDICRLAKGGCKAELITDDLVRVHIPDPQIYIPDQVRGAYVDLPHTDFVANVTVNLDALVSKYSIIDGNVPSIQMTVGTDALGSGYSLEIVPFTNSVSKTISGMTLQYRWQVRALAADGMTKENLFAGSILASGNLGVTAPQTLQARVQDGLLQFAINGAVFTPAIAATNVAGTQLGFSSRSVDVAFTGADVVLKP